MKKQRENKPSGCQFFRLALSCVSEEVNLKVAELQEFSDNQANTIEVLREQLALVTAEKLETGKLFTPSKSL